jgi:hypothetical protein
MQKLIFRRGGELVLSYNGSVEKGTWDYLVEASCLLVDRNYDKILLKEEFIDENVMILKRDGTDNEFFSLANDKTLPDLNIEAYLDSLYKEELRIKELVVYSNQILHIVDGQGKKADVPIGKRVLIKNDNLEYRVIDDGLYLSANAKYTIVVQDGLIKRLEKNVSFKSSTGESFFAVGGSEDDILLNRNKSIIIDGTPVETARLQTQFGTIFSVAQGTVQNIYFLKQHKLSNGWIIDVEQKNRDSISKGDKIIDARPFFPVPDGSYRIEWDIFKTKIKDSTII